MLTLLLVGIALLIGLILFGSWYVNAEPKAALKALKWVGILGFLLISFFFFFTGRLSWAFFGIPVLFPWLMRARALARAAKTCVPGKLLEDCDMLFTECLNTFSYAKTQVTGA